MPIHKIVRDSSVLGKAVVFRESYKFLQNLYL